MLLKKSLLGLSVVLFSANVMAWGDLGHTVIGEIAQRNLTPKGKALVYEYLGAEPLGVSATWPDLVRSDSRFKNFANYHFLDIQHGLNFDNRIKAPIDGNTILEQVPGLLSSKKLNTTQKGILLRYLVHLVGDLHQPLHVGNGADRGANLCLIDLKNSKTGKKDRINLHTTWDTTLVELIKDESQSAQSDTSAKKYFNYQDLVDYLEKQVAAGTIPVDREAELKKSNPAWYADSRALHSLVYPDENPVNHPKDRPYCRTVEPDPKDPNNQIVVNGAFKESEIPTLKDEYLAKALPTIKRQLYLGGLRLAKILNETAEKNKKLKPWSEAREKAYFDAIEIKNPDKREPSSVKAACEH